MFTADPAPPALLGDWLVREELAAGSLADLVPDHKVAATTFETAAWRLYPSPAQRPRKTRLVVDFVRSRLR